MENCKLTRCLAEERLKNTGKLDFDEIFEQDKKLFRIFFLFQNNISGVYEKFNELIDKIQENKNEYFTIKDEFVKKISVNCVLTYMDGVKLFSLIEKQFFLLLVINILKSQNLNFFKQQI